MNDRLPTSDEVLLVVYAVLWAGALPTFGRQRIFAVNAFFTSEAAAREHARNRFLLGVVLANLGPALMLAALLRFAPDARGFWGVVSGALLGITPTVFPRLVHAYVASDKRRRSYYDDDEWRFVMEQWDPVWHPHRRAVQGESKSPNRDDAHVYAALWMLAPSLILGTIIGLLAS